MFFYVLGKGELDDALFAMICNETNRLCADTMVPLSIANGREIGHANAHDLAGGSFTPLSLTHVVSCLAVCHCSPLFVANYGMMCGYRAPVLPTK